MKLWIAIVCSCWLFACSDIENPPANIDFANGLNPTELKNAQGQQTDLSKKVASCVTISDETNACSLETLPFIGSAATSGTPSKQQIMDRLLVSHQWMADNFSVLLDDMPEDMYRLFGSTTAIVIDADVRPAFFWAATGAIYLDPYYLWMTEGQKNTISTDKDYRSSFDDELGFMRVAQYSKQGQYPFGSSHARTQQEALYALSALLFHELAHASDYFPLARLNSVDSSAKPADLAMQLATERASRQLASTYPLQSTILYALGQVQFKGVTPTAGQKAMTAGDVGNHFALDGASDAYNYATLNEDAAMLFEETMMKIHYDIDREMAFATVLATPTNICSNISLDWKSINRILEDHVLPRAELVVNQLLPNHSHQDFFSNPPESRNFSVCEPMVQARNIALPPQTLHHDHWH